MIEFETIFTQGKSMIEVTSYHVSLEPVAAPRPRSSFFGGRSRSYMPKKYMDWKKEFVRRIIAQGVEEPIDSAVYIRIEFIFQRPKRLMRRKDPREKIYKASSPDIDNLCKSVLDALQDALVIKNDSCVVGLSAMKYYGALTDDKKSEHPHMIIDIYKL